MKKLLLASAASFVLASSAALAADLPVKGPAYIPQAPVVDPWGGFYYGANLGYSSGRVEYSTSSSVLSTGLTSTTNSERSLTGVIGGGQIGWNWNLAPNWIWGIEADFQGSDQKNDGSTVSLDNVTVGAVTTTLTTTTTAEQKLDWFGTARVRLGWVVGNTLWYGTAGYAYGSVKASNSTTRVPGVAGNASIAGAGTTTATKSGWTAGLGAETKLWGNWTAKLEYLFVDLGTLNNSYNVLLTSGGGAGGVASHFSSDAKFQDHIFRVGLNYLFR